MRAGRGDGCREISEVANGSESWLIFQLVHALVLEA